MSEIVLKPVVHLIIKNTVGKQLMQFRDNNPGIESPLLWGFFGGHIENNESIEESSQRELFEELNIKLKLEDFEFIHEESINQYHVHFVKVNRPIEWQEIKVNEGAGCAYFSKQELELIPVSDTIKKVLAREFELLK